MFVRAINSLSDLLSSDLPPALRWRVAQTAAWLAVVKGSAALGFPRSMLPNPVSIAGFRVSYFHLNQLVYLFKEIFLNAQYLFQTDDEQPLIIDCGSNIGIGILFFKSLYPKAHVIGFEPDPETFHVLKNNIEENHLIGVDVYQCALSSEEGTVKFFHDDRQKGSLLMSLYQERLAGDVIIVPARLLSPFITREVELLKMDIEGAEAVVLPELAESGKLQMVKQIHLEYHHHIRQQKDELSPILKLLEDNNFGYYLTADKSRGKLPSPRDFQDIAIYGYRK
jgi:FkbM family methyltransferase